MRRCCHFRKKGPLKCCNVYIFFFKIRYGAFGEAHFHQTFGETHYPKKKRKPESPNHISRSKFRLTLTCNSSVQLHIHIDRTSVLQPIQQANKENPKGSQKRRNESWKPLFVLWNSENWKSLFVLCNNRQFRSYPIFALQQQTI